MTAPIEIIEVKPLSVREENRRKELESVIEKNFAAFVEVGLALTEIRESKLYRTTHTTFAAYCTELWDCNKSRAHQLINSALVVRNLSTMVDKIEGIPKNERQCRPLAGLPMMDQVALWEEAVETAPDGKVTAAHVKRTAQIWARKKQTKTANKTRQTVTDSIDSLLAQIQTEINSNWKTTSKEEAVRHLRTLIDAIEG
ncbi:hypothetical protein ACFL6N_07900 [Thermodesulfobacteriota bacterium]